MLETRLLQTALDSLRELPDGCRVLLPLSPGAVVAPSVQRDLSRAARLARRILLDITPAGEPVDLEDFVAAVEPVRRDGAGLALLAGASPGGLDALPRLRPDLVKVGRDYVAGMETDGARRAVVEGLVALVEALGGRVLAVGIEDQSQLDALCGAASRSARASASAGRSPRWPQGSRAPARRCSTTDPPRTLEQLQPLRPVMA